MAMGETAVNFETFLKENAFDKRELTIEDLTNNQCLDDNLLMLSDKLDNWEMTGFYLGLSEPEVTAIKVDCTNEERRRARTLSKWKEKKGEDANYHSLIQALIKARRKDVACQALDYLKEEIMKQKEIKLQKDLELEQEMKENFLKRIKSQILAKGLDVPDLQVNLRHEDIDEIIKLIGKDWYTFGLCMGVDESTLDSIKEVEGIDKLGRKRKLLEHLISIKSRYEDVIYGLYNSAEECNPSIDGVLDYLFTIRIKQQSEAEPNSHIQNSGIQDQRSKPSENQLHQNLTESSNADPLLCKKQKKPRLPWQAVFDIRRKNGPRSLQLFAIHDLKPSNYREHFYGTLWLEEGEHINKLEGKCDGIDYKLTIYDAQKVPDYLAQNRRYNSLQGYISGRNFTDDKIEYATQASDNVKIMRADGSNICEAYKHHYNFNHLENHMYVVVPRSHNLHQAMKNGVKVKDGCEFKVRAQFIVKHSYFDHLHDAVIKVPDYVLEALLPISFSFRQLCLTFEPQYSDSRNFRYMKLDNKHQLKALAMIASDSVPPSPHCPPPPVILYGPFGSGKTRILARAAYEIMMNGIQKKVCTRILISAHHEISITTFIFAYFGVIARGHHLPFKVILVSRKENKGKYANMYMTPEEFAEESDNIRRMNHIVVIATYTMSLNFYQYLYSSEGFFTHLFLDEAAQVREPEAIIPLTLATKNAKIVLAGDNKQVGPNILVLGEEARRHDLHVSLLERLMTRYKEIGAEATQYITRLSVNYRSDDSLIDIPNLFYENLELNADKSLQKFSGPTGYRFVSADSKLVMEYAHPDQPLVEACIVLEEVRSYLERMKQINPKFNPRHDVCIITSTRKQLNNIKSMAYQYKEYEAVRKVSFQPSFMIQGHEFKAVFLSLFELVQQDELNASYIKSLFNPYVFNTAITRAKYYVVAIGMPKKVQQFEQETISDPGRGGNDTQCWHKYLALCKEQRTLIHHPDIPSAVLKRAKQTQASVPPQVPGLPAKNDTEKGKDRCKEESKETSEHTKLLALEETVKKLEKEKNELAELVKKLQKELEEEKSKNHGDVKTASKELDGASTAMPKKERNMEQAIVKAHMDDSEGMASDFTEKPRRQRNRKNRKK